MDLLQPIRRILRAHGGPAPRPARQSHRPPSLRRRLLLEPLEARRILATIIVDSLADNLDSDGRITLREAVIAANNDAVADAVEGIQRGDGVDVIEFDPSLMCGTIILSGGELSVTASLELRGLGADHLTISGNDQSRIFFIDDGINDPVAEVTMSGLTLTGGRADYGGAIASVENITIDGLSIVGNTAQSSGGGLHLNGRRLLITNTTIASNQARVGGGVYIQGIGDMRISGTTIESNQAERSGGGVIALLSFGTLDIESAQIRNNTAGASGGGLDLHANGEGGATVTDSVIEGNTAGFYGGGVHLGTAYFFAETHLAGSLISGNSAGYSGGGVYASNQHGYIEILNATISGNHAAHTGGGIATEGEIFISHSTITDNTASGALGVGSPAAGIAWDRTLGQRRIHLDHAIVAANAGELGVANDVSVVDRVDLLVANSLIGDASGTDLAEAPIAYPDGNGNLIGGPIHGVIDPLLGPLADNGGPAPAHALLPGSPAIDTGDPAAVAGANDVPAFDQRGEPFARITDGDGDGRARIDIGAFELQEPHQPQLLPGDFNGNGLVEQQDLDLVLAHWGRTVDAASPTWVSQRPSGHVDQRHLDAVLANWGEQLPLASVKAPPPDALKVAQEKSPASDETSPTLHAKKAALAQRIKSASALNDPIGPSPREAAGIAKSALRIQ